MKKSQMLGAVLAVPLMIGLLDQRNALAAGARDTHRPIVEATALFRVVLAKETRQPCKYPTAWLKQPLPDDVAKKFFGPTRRADLLAPDIPKSPREIVDPKNKMADAFCDDTQTRAFVGTLRAAMLKVKDAQGASVDSTDFSFPIFDASYQKAVVIVFRSHASVQRLDHSIYPMKPGIVFMPGEGDIEAELYKKTRAGWKLIAREEIGVT